MTTMNRAIQNGTIKKSKTGFPLKASVEKFKRTFVVSKSPKKKLPNKKRWANYSNNESPSPNKKPNSNSNENFNYFMKGPTGSA